MESLAHKQATTCPISHGEDKDGEGGWDGYPPDLQTARDKYYVDHSENRDQTEEVSDSETPGPVSTRTRSKKGSASRYDSRRGDDDAGADRSAAATGGGDATFGAHQRGASLMSASKEDENKLNSEVECQSEVSDVERSDTEYAEVPRTWGSRMEVAHNSDDSGWLQCDSEVAFKNQKPRAAREVNSQNQSGQT